MKRALDILLSGSGLVASAPLWVLLAMAIKLEDGGPVLYRQQRVGKDGADFELLKLRTMVVGAEHQGAGFAVDAGDQRITRVGRVLRRLSLDELPQLWNVLRGQMSLVGPRPLVPEEDSMVDGWERRRLELLRLSTGPEPRPIFARVWGPAMPSATSPWWRCQRLRARSV